MIFADLSKKTLWLINHNIVIHIMPHIPYLKQNGKNVIQK